VGVAADVWPVDHTLQDGTTHILSGSCTHDRNCNLLGVCNSNGVCDCDSGWTGRTCSVPDLKPLNTSLGHHNLFAATWGGRAIHEPSTGNWHLFVAQFSNRFDNRCPLSMCYTTAKSSVSADERPRWPVRVCVTITSCRRM
jgi:hypothetical protein